MSLAVAQASPVWRKEWPQTDFSRTTVPLSEVRDAGPGRDGIAAIVAPVFLRASQPYPLKLADTEPVIVLQVGEDVRFYPLRIMTRHEIINDVVGAEPVVITYCPLCNSAIAFARRIAGTTLLFGVTGKLRNSNLIMYDGDSESWWQQFTGDAIVGERAGTRLKALTVHIAPYLEAKSSHRDARIVAPAIADQRFYRNPYVRYDSRRVPFPFADGKWPADIQSMSYVVSVGPRAWSLALLADAGRIVSEDLVLTWTRGMNSALDRPDIARGRDIGAIRVQRSAGGHTRDVRHEVTFAFVFRAFYPDGQIIVSPG